MAKTKEKDALIEQLLKTVEEKKKQIDRIKNPIFKTNLSFPMEMFGSPNRVNLNVTTDEVLFFLLVHLNNLIRESNGVQPVEFPKKWHGFKLEDWRDDVILKITQKQSQIQISELKAIEAKLNDLISEDKKKDIELDNLKTLLGV
jgi:hypothetical protein